MIVDVVDVVDDCQEQNGCQIRTQRLRIYYI